MSVTEPLAAGPEPDHLGTNLAALFSADPEMAHWLEREPDQDWAETAVNPDGSPNLRLRLGPKSILLSDPADPWAGPGKAAAGAERKAGYFSLLIGLGLGHTAEAIAQIMEPGHRILVVEPLASIIRQAFRRTDLSRLLSSGALILAGPEENRLEAAVLRLLEGRFGAGGGFPVYEEGYTREAALDIHYQGLRQAALGLIRSRMSMGLATAAYGLEVGRNEVLATPRLLAQPGVNDLAGAFQGRPAVLVSTGPSLAKNIHLLPSAGEGAVIIALIQALRPLLAYGVKPDLVCYGDVYSGNWSHFRGLTAIPDLPLVVYPNTALDLIRQWQGPLLVTERLENQRPDFFGRLWRKKGEIGQGDASAHLLLALARHLGADPIILVGQDLAREGSTGHFSQVDNRERISLTKDGQIKIDLDDQYSAQNLDKTFFQWSTSHAPGYFGGTVVTDFLEQIYDFERMIRNSRARVINSTEGGARIKGALQMPLVEALARHCGEPVDKGPIRSLGRKSRTVDYEECLAALDGEAEAMEGVVGMARQGLANCRRLRPLQSPGRAGQNAKNLVKSSKSNDKLIQKLNSATRERMLLSFSVMGTGEMKKVTALGSDPAQAGVLEAVLRRQELIFRAFEAGARDLAQAYRTSGDLLERFLEARDRVDQSPQEPGTLLEWGRALEELGEAGRAGQVYDRLVELFPGSLPGWELKARLALRQENFREAERAIGRLTGLPQGRAIAEELGEELETTLEGLLAHADQDLAQGYFARPLLMARKYLQARPGEARAEAVVRAAEKGLAESIIKAQTGVEDSATLQERYQEMLQEARTLGREGRGLERALEILSRAVSLLPGRLEARWGLATTFHALGRLEEAEREYAALVGLEPDNHQLRYERGLVLIKLGRLGQGLEELVRAAEGNQNLASSLPQVGELFIRAGRPEAAVRVLENHLERQEADHRSWSRLGDCFLEMGKAEAAAASFRRALELRPGFGPALEGQARLSGRAAIGRVGRAG